MEEEGILELPGNNLYRNGVVFVLDNGEELLLREPLAFDPTLTDQYHVLKALDTTDYLAWYFYKGIAEDPSKFWWVIADANLIFNPLDMAEYVAAEMLIPNIVKAQLRI